MLTSNQSTPEPSDWKCCHCHLSYILNCNTTQVMTKQCCCCFFVFFSQACTCRNLPSKSERWCNPYHACSRDLLCWLFCLRAEWDKQEVRRLWNSHTCIHASQCFRAKCIPCRLLSKAHYVVAISQYVIAAVIPRFVVYSNITAFLTLPVRSRFNFTGLYQISYSPCNIVYIHQPWHNAHLPNCFLLML